MAARKGPAPLCTPDVVARICAAIRAGATHEAAAGAAGIARKTLQTWKARGEAGEEPYAAFSEGLARAHEEGQVRLVAIIANAAVTDWKAAAWILERRHRDDFGKYGPDGPPRATEGVSDAVRDYLERLAAPRAP